MKKILLIAAAIMILVPFTVNAEMIAVNDMAMEEITGQAGIGLTVAAGDLNVGASTGSSPIDVDLISGIIGATVEGSVALNNNAAQQSITLDTGAMSLTADLGGLALTSDVSLGVDLAGMTLLTLDLGDLGVTVNNLKVSVGML